MRIGPGHAGDAAFEEFTETLSDARRNAPVGTRVLIPDGVEIVDPNDAYGEVVDLATGQVERFILVQETVGEGAKPPGAPTGNPWHPLIWIVPPLLAAPIGVMIGRLIG